MFRNNVHRSTPREKSKFDMTENTLAGAGGVGRGDLPGGWSRDRGAGRSGGGARGRQTWPAGPRPPGPLLAPGACRLHNRSTMTY